jgi:hypothetical protein
MTAYVLALGGIAMAFALVSTVAAVILDAKIRGRP